MTSVKQTDFVSYSKGFFQCWLARRKEFKGKSKEKNTESDFEKFILKELQSLTSWELAKIGKGFTQFRIIQQETLTTNTGKWSNIADIVVYGHENKKLPLVIFELKLDYAIESYNGGSMEDAEKQLCKYCQLAKAPYWILMTESDVIIFEYDHSASKPNPFKIDKIPHFHIIEDLLIKNQSNSSPNEKKVVEVEYMMNQFDKVEKASKNNNDEILKLQVHMKSISSYISTMEKKTRDVTK